MDRRTVLEMSQTELAKRSTTTQQTISRVELGDQKPGDELRVRIAKALGCKVAELFGYEDA